MNLYKYLKLGITGSTSIYQWRCPPLDRNSNRHYLPEREEIFNYTWEKSMPNTTYIYHVNKRILNCNGTVTAVEFCYTTTSTINSRGQRKVFTLLILNQSNGQYYNVTKSIPVFSYKCNASRCCELMTLQDQDQFNLTKSDFYIGLSSESDHNLNGLHSSVYLAYRVKSYLLNRLPALNEITKLTGNDCRTPRLMWFHISK